MKVQRFELSATGLALLDGSGSELVTLTPAPVSLDSTSWVVKEFGYPETVPLGPVTLRFSGGTLSVQTGCGVLTGQYRQNTEELVVTFDATALPACPTAELRRQQANLKKELTQVTGFQRDGSQIMLLSAEGVRVVKGALGRGIPCHFGLDVQNPPDRLTQIRALGPEPRGDGGSDHALGEMRTRGFEGATG